MAPASAVRVARRVPGAREGDFRVESRSVGEHRVVELRARRVVERCALGIMAGRHGTETDETAGNRAEHAGEVLGSGQRVRQRLVPVSSEEIADHAGHERGLRSVRDGRRVSCDVIDLHVDVVGGGNAPHQPGADSSTRSRACVENVRTVASKAAVSGMTLAAVPACNEPTEMTTGSKTSKRRVTMVCNEVTISLTAVTGSRALCGLEPCPPDPCTVTCSSSEAESIVPSWPPNRW